jgi:hypothetical protein
MLQPNGAPTCAGKTPAVYSLSRRPLVPRRSAPVHSPKILPRAKPQSCTGVTRWGPPALALRAAPSRSLTLPNLKQPNRPPFPEASGIRQLESIRFIRSQHFAFAPATRPCSPTALCRHNCHIASRISHAIPHHKPLPHNNLQPPCVPHPQQNTESPIIFRPLTQGLLSIL